MLLMVRMKKSCVHCTVCEYPIVEGVLDFEMEALKLMIERKVNEYWPCKNCDREGSIAANQKFVDTVNEIAHKYRITGMLN